MAGTDGRLGKRQAPAPAEGERPNKRADTDPDSWTGVYLSLFCAPAHGIAVNHSFRFLTLGKQGEKSFERGGINLSECDPSSFLKE